MFPIKRFFPLFKDILYTTGILGLSFLLSLFAQNRITTQILTPMLFVLGVFLISLQTRGYYWGIAASLVGVLAVNYAFTFPYYAIDLTSPEPLAEASVMLAVSVMTSTLTVKLRRHEVLRIEHEKEKMRANLLRAVSHDLRTPLTSIYGSCSAIIENYDSLDKSRQLKLLGEMRSDAEWLTRMVENLLSVTRIESDGMQVAKTPTVLEELIDSVLVRFHKRCPQQAVTLQIPEEFVSIPMDAMLIGQVLTNLLENAVDHAKGMTELILRVDAQEGFAHFTVRDNGCGIAPNRFDQLFTGYLPPDNIPSDGRRSNMGIGLSVCSAIIKAHGSEIFAQNCPGGGAAFTFSLKMEEEDE